MKSIYGDNTNFPKEGLFILTSLTSIRAIAAIFVVIHHAVVYLHNYAVIDWIAKIGWLGVTLFFLLSGFVLMWSYNTHIPKRTFVLRRFARIYPLHFVCLIGSILAYFIFARPCGGYVGTSLGTFANFFLVHGWVSGHPEIRQAWNGVSWTLSCEFFFYILSPFIFPIILSQFSISLIYLILIWLTVFIVTIKANQEFNEDLLDFLYMHPIPRLLEFLIGAVCARLVLNSWGPQSVWLGLGLLFIPIFFYYNYVPESARFSATISIMAIPGFTWIIMSLARRDLRGYKSLMNYRLMVLLGKSSYALYMTHALFLGAFVFCIQKFFELERISIIFGSLLTVIYLMLALVISIAVHFWIEVPAHRYFLMKIKY